MQKFAHTLGPVWIFIIPLCAITFTLPGQEAATGNPDRYTCKYGAITRGNQGEKSLALIFTGDLYAESGTSIVATLEKYNIGASFFLTGNFYRNPSFSPLINSLVTAGHYLGAHSDTHLLYCDWNNRDSLLVSREQFIQDLEKNYQEMALFGIRKEDAPYFLPPFEWYNDSISSWTGSLGLQLVNDTPGTFSHADYTIPGTPGYRSSREIFQSILDEEQAAPCGLNGFMLLMHLGSGPDRDDKFHDYLEPLLDSLTKKGYRFETVAALLGN
jgi:endoglucanase